MLSLAQLLDRVSSCMSRDVIRNVFALGFQVLKRKHSRADDLSRSADAVRVVSHFRFPVVAALGSTMTNKFSISHYNEQEYL